MTAAAGRGRPRLLLAAGVADSFGLSFGWTTFTLLAVIRGGLPLAGLYNAAMFAGVVLSAPVAGWLAGRVHGRTLLAATGAAELLLRVAVVPALVTGVPSPVIAGAVAAMNVMAWTAYAGMRAELAAADPDARWLTRYATAIAAVEALGAAVAALLPLGAPGRLHSGVIAAVIVLYGGSLLPQFLCARHALVRAGRVRGPRRITRILPRRTGGLLGGSVLLMLVASGPGSLGVALADELGGQRAVLPSAVAFTAGCLAAPALHRGLRLSSWSPRSAWPLMGVGMVAGWVVAPWNLAGLVLAQTCSGLFLTAYQGDMDTRVAARAEPARATAALAWAAATRAVGTALAVRCVPWLIAADGIGTAAGGAALLVAAGAGTTAVLHRRPRVTGVGQRTPAVVTIFTTASRRPCPARRSSG